MTAKFSPGDGGIQPWRVLVTQQRAELFAPIHRALWTTGGLGALLAGLLALLGVFAARRLTRPILALQEGAEILADGDLRHRLSVRTGDELETLADSINRMAGNLQQFEAERLKAERLMALHRLSTVLTHDLRGPLVGILKALALFRETYGKMQADQAGRLLSELIRGGDLLLGTLNDLLDVYRHSLSALPLRYTDFVLEKAVEEVLLLLEADAQALGIKVERVTNASGDLSISADRRRLQRVLFNLLDNAMKHSPSGGRIVLAIGRPEQDKVSLRIDDQGPGISNEETSRIFEFLYEAPSPAIDRPHRNGVGVGLYFCRVTLEAHGGDIQVENLPEGGARFTVVLPLTRPALMKAD